VARGFHARIDMLLRHGFKRALTATLRIKPLSIHSTPHGAFASEGLHGSVPQTGVALKPNPIYSWWS
jgi:hypothetical protein